MMFDELIKKTNIKTEYYDKVERYLHKYADRKASPEIIKQITTAIMVLSKIDLSKVHFVDSKDICKEHNVSVTIGRENLFELKMQNIDVETIYNAKLVDEIVLGFNKMMEDEGGVIINEICETIKTEDINADIKISYISYILPYNVYRGIKITKLKNIINNKYDKTHIK